MNAIALMGTLQSEPELRFTQDGLARLSTLLGFSAGRPEEPDFQIRMVAFGNLAEEVARTLHHGDGVLVEGRLQAETRGRPDGTKEKVTELIARKVYPATVGESLAGATPAPAAAPAASAKNGAPAARPAPRPAAPARPTAPEPDLDDIPF
ncbi:single-stranded DNA-binding protein [Gloeobacter violaceus]|uniref:Ycf41 protein n=1 Tax=Gloeobacter violaceus (strain ATCC 29082 / PCC 7421) TaxID=251221 RepID=Q7NNH8_GLOVI|nr:single-stranded DNA-binding protein [Gloeobacter violaceus]BAC88374.1 ycf41 [Gloeobacter violaceus PCC 7421]